MEREREREREGDGQREREGGVEGGGAPPPRAGRREVGLHLMNSL